MREGRCWWFTDNSIKIVRCLLHSFNPPTFYTAFYCWKIVFSFLLCYQFVDITGSRSCIIKISIFSTRGHVTGTSIERMLFFHYQTRKRYILENKIQHLKVNCFLIFSDYIQSEFLFEIFLMHCAVVFIVQARYILISTSNNNVRCWIFAEKSFTNL